MRRVDAKERLERLGRIHEDAQLPFGGLRQIDEMQFAPAGEPLPCVFDAYVNGISLRLRCISECCWSVGKQYHPPRTQCNSVLHNFKKKNHIAVTLLASEGKGHWITAL
jgi:hypothetical protein